MLVKDLKVIEFELSSRCNARCPGCERTFKGETHPDLQLNDITLSQYKKILPSKDYIENKEICYCGVMGDPLVNPEFYEICEYTLSMDPDVITVSTNGGLRSKEYWTKLGTLSSKDPRLTMGFAVDGFEKTNHIYRVGVNWNKLVENMTAYSNAGGRGEWIYNPFDHNLDDIDKAKELANNLGFKFLIRYSVKQEKTVSAINKKTKETVNKISLTNHTYQHPEDVRKKKVSKSSKTKSYSPNIKCKTIHEKEIFIGANYQMWPCCFLYDQQVGFSYPKEIKENFIGKFSKYGDKWNDLLTHDIQEILNHEWFSKTLEESWDPTHPMFLQRCQKNCSLFGKKNPIFIEN